MNLATLAYIPPRRVPGAAAFVQNISHWKSRYPVHLYSDDPFWNPAWAVDDPEKARTNKWYSLSNCIFLMALHIARQLNLDFFLYLEADSRVRGHEWDGQIFDEHFSLGPDCKFSGSPVLWNIHGAGQTNMERSLEYAAEVKKRTGRAPCIFANRQPHDQSGVVIYPNGSAAIYHVPTLNQIFGALNDANFIQVARNMTAWDLVIGFSMWGLFGDKTFDAVQALSTVYSGCTDIFASYDERKEMLMSGQKLAVHQIKTDDPLI